MREYMCEDDYCVAEVQSVHMDGSLSLHTRNSKYGKLFFGHCFQLNPMLVKRLFHVT